jgi:hypothetical protein
VTRKCIIACFVVILMSGCVFRKFNCQKMIGKTRQEVVTHLLSIQPKGVTIQAGLPVYQVKTIEQIEKDENFMSAKEWQIQTADSGIIYNYSACILVFDSSGKVVSQKEFKTMQP